MLARNWGAVTVAPLSPTFSHSCCGDTGLLWPPPWEPVRGSQCCGSVSILASRPRGPRNVSSWLPGLAGGSGVGGVPGPAASLLCLGVFPHRVAGTAAWECMSQQRLCMCHFPSCLIVFPFCPRNIMGCIRNGVTSSSGW